MYNKTIKKAVYILFVTVLFGSGLNFSVHKAAAHTGGDINCTPPTYGEKYLAGNGYSAADANGTFPVNHCNSWINIESETQVGSNLVVSGEIFGGGINSVCTDEISGEQYDYISSVDDPLNTIPTAYDGKANPIVPTISTWQDPISGSCNQGPIDVGTTVTPGQQYYGQFSYTFSLAGYTGGQTYRAYIGMAPTVNGPYSNGGGINTTYTDNYTKYTSSQCETNGWPSSEDCRDYWSYQDFVPVAPASGTVAVNADRSTSWLIGGGSSYSGSGTSATYANSPASSSGTRYNLTDPYLNPPYGFTDNPTFVMRNTNSLLARIVKSAEASDCGNPDTWTCDLSTGGTITFNLSSTQCSITVQTTFNGGSPTAIGGGLGYSVSGPVNSSSTYSNTSQTFDLVADPSGTTFTLNGFPSTITYGGYTSDLASITPSNPYTCSGGSSMTFSANYVSRANINVQ